MIDKEFLNGLAVNGEVADHDIDSLLVRVNATEEAANEIAAAYREKLEESGTAPEDQEWRIGLDQAAYQAACIIYETGSPAFGSDATAATERFFEYAPLEVQEAWSDQSEDYKQMTISFVQLGSLLSDEDKEPAFGPHIDGRHHELMDGIGAQYNKYGILLRQPEISDQ